MAKIDQLVHLDMNNNQIQNVSFQTLAVPPVTTNLPIGWFYWNTADKTAYAWTGTDWKDLGANYVHPSYAGTGQPQTALTGAKVISKINLENGHVTGVEERDLTPANIGAAPASHTHTTANITALTDYTLGTDTPIVATDSLNTALGKIQKQIDGKTNNTGTVTSVNATVPTGLTVSGGPITESGTLNFAYASGYQGYTTAEANKLAGIAENANNYVLPTASGTVLGGVKVGSNLSIDNDGKLNASFTETDPIYTASIPNQMMWKGVIPANSDLDTYINTGIYGVSNNSLVSSIVNIPTGLNHSFTLEVISFTDSRVAHRILTRIGLIYTRHKDSTGWTAWRKVALTTDLNNYIPTSHPVNGITSTNITNWNTAFGWGDFRQFGLGTGHVIVTDVSQIGHAGKFYRMSTSTTGNTMGAGAFLNMPFQGGQTMMLKLNSTDASVGSIDNNNVVTKHYDLWNSLNLTAGTLTSLNTVGETVDKIWSSKNLNDWLSSKNYASASQLANYIPTSHVVNNITQTNINNWNEAYGWGTHVGKYLSLTGGTVNGNVRLNSGSNNVIPESGSAITNYALSIGTPTNGMQFRTLGNGQGYIQQTRTDGTATDYILNLNHNGGQVKVGPGGFESGGTIKFSGLGEGFVKSSANGTLSVDNTSYATSAELGNRIPYTGADKAIDFGTQMITHNGVKRSDSSVESPWLASSLSQTNKVEWLIIENINSAGSNRRFIVEIESIGGNGQQVKLKKTVTCALLANNTLSITSESFTEVQGGVKQWTIGTIEKNSDTSIKIPIIVVGTASTTVKNKITVKNISTSVITNVAFSILTDPESTLTGVAPRNTEDNYIGVDNEQLALSGNKKTTGQWTFNNSVNIGTDTSEAPLTIRSESYNEYKQMVLSGGLTNGNQKLWLGAITNNSGSYISNNSYYSGPNVFKPNYESASGIRFRESGSIDFIANTGLTVGTDYTPTTRLRITNDGKVTVADLAGTGNRMVVASSSGVLSTQAIPSAQVLNLGTLPGQINLSGGGGNVQLDSLKLPIRNDSNVRLIDQSFRPYMTAADNLNYPVPTTHGSGIRTERSSGVNSTGFDIYHASGRPELYYKTFSSTSTETAWKIIADREWVTAENFLKVVNLGYTASVSNGTITNTGGTNVTVPAATSSMAGLMLPAEKTKLNNIEANANNYLHPTANPGTHPFATELTSGVQVLSQLVVNNEGHVVTVKGRNLTAADLASVMINNASNTATDQTWSASKIYTEVQAAINQAQTGALQYKGDYNPSTNTPAITTDATVKTGFTYVVTATGTFAGQAVEAGDMIIAKINNPGATAANWQIVNKNIPAIVSASTTVEGIIQLATNAEAIAGTNATKAITPATLKAAMDAAVGGFSIAFGNGSSINFDITHGLNTQFVTVMIYRASDMRQVIMQVAPTSASVVNIQCNTAPTNNQYIVVIKK